MVLFLPRKDKEGHLKAEDVAACQKCYNHSVHDKGGNTSKFKINLLSHLKMYGLTLHGFIKSE